MDSTQAPLKIAIAGGGGIARKAYLPLLRTWPGTQLVGLYSRSQQTVDEVCRDWQIDFGTTNLEALLERKPDAVFVLTSTDSHVQITRPILESGVDVFLEKPATESSRSAFELADLAQGLGRVYMVGFNRRYATLYRQARDLFADRKLELLVVEKHRPTAFHVSLYNNYLDDTVHQIDLVRFFGGEAQAVHTSFEMRQGRVVNALSILALPGGGQAVVMTCLQAGAWQEKVSLHGGKLSVEVSAFREMRVRYPDHEVVYGNDRPGTWTSELTERGFSGQIAHFFSCVRTHSQPDPDGYSAARTQALVEELTRKAGQGTEFLPYAEGVI